MKKLFKWLTLTVLSASLVLSTVGCAGKTPPSGDGGDPSTPGDPDNPAVVPPELSELLDDEYASASRGGMPEVPRYPEDEEWKLLVEKQYPIKAGESFTETFDGNYFTSRLSAIGDGAQYGIVTGEKAIEGKSLRMVTEGNYAGIRLTGMRFAAGGTYRIKMDYNVISPSNDFFFQFRDATAGAASDVFATFGSAAGTGVLDHTFTLGMYSNYYIMIMPRTAAGEVVIDNISISRLDSRPVASDLRLKGEIEVGKTVTADYTYTDYEGDEEGETEFKWFAALSAGGLNKVILDNTGKSLTITDGMLGKYIGFQVIPKAKTGESSVGLPVLYMATDTVGGSRPAYGTKFSLEEGDSFTEDFEADVGEEKNLVYVPHGNTDDYIYHDAGRNSNVLRIKSDGAYLGTDFSGISFTARGVYRISFDYAFNVIPNTFYVQLRSSAGDSFYQVPTNVTAGEWKKAQGILEIGKADDAFLMMFPDASPVEMLIDNLKIERIAENDESILNQPFFISDRSVNENFESLLNRQLYPVAKNATAKVTDARGESIDGNSLCVAAASAQGEVLMKGAKARGGQSFTVEFSYSMIEGSGLSVGFASEDGTGGGIFVPVEDVGAGIHNAIVRLTAPEGDKEYYLVFRVSSGTKAAIDNVKAEWLNMDAVGDYETFDGTEVYLRSVFGGAQMQVDTVTAGNLLTVTAPADGGVQFAFNGVQSGKTYAVTFTYSVSASETNNNLFVRSGDTGTAVQFDAEQGAAGRKTVYLTASSDGAKFCIGATTQSTFTLDDVFIQADTRSAGALSEAGEGLRDESGKFSIDVNNDSSVGFTNEARYQSVLSSGYVVLVESKGGYGGIQIRNSDWNLESGTTFKIKMTYTIVSNPNNSEIYVQLGASGVFKTIGGDETAVGVQKTVEIELTKNGAFDCIMLFGGGGANGLTFTLDDFTLTIS